MDILTAIGIGALITAAVIALILGLAIKFWKPIVIAVLLVSVVVIVVGEAKREIYKPLTEQERAALQEQFRKEAEDTALIAYAIWYEARGEQEIGKRAVATVIWNRAGGDPEKLTSVLLKKNWLGNKPKLNADDGDWSDPVLSEECWTIARSMRAGDFKPLGKWTHFWNPRLAEPDWADAGTNYIAIGNHAFCVIP